MTSRILIAFLLAIVSYAAVDNDEITNLPGWVGNFPSKQYSGYLNPSKTSHLHYWLVLAETSPETSPLVIWFNGGPGCSSMDGFFYEHGPFEVNPKNYDELKLRAIRWSSAANVLYIESPVGVGFSYSDDKDYAMDDDRVALENRGAVQDFYKKFPEFLSNDLFITGESYAGIYVPTLAQAIIEGQNDGTYTGAKLTGIAVGNGCSGNDIGICGFGPQGTYYEWKYLMGTALLPADLKETVNNACDWSAAAANKENALSVKCQAVLDLASQRIGHVDLYNIYGDCIFNDGCALSNNGAESHSKIPVTSYLSPPSSGNENLRRSILGGPDACIDSAAASAYLNKPAVMAALHVRDPGFCWSVCKTVPGWTYKSTRANLPKNTYPLLVSHIHVIIYNGDWDACVPYTDNEAWTSSMGFKVKTHWHPWTYTSTAGNSNQVAGYAVEYDVSHLGGGSFHFVTVKGGRHEVPASSPAQALELLTRLTRRHAF